MRLQLGSPVRCSDGVYGELADVVIDPTKRQVTHLVVAPRHRHDLARLVPVDRAHSGRKSDAEIVLGDTIAEIDQLEPVQQSAFLRLGSVPIEDPDWDVGIEDFLALPYYGNLVPGDLGMAVAPIGYDDQVTETYDRVPKDTIEIRRASAVTSADGYHLGHVEGFIVDGEEHITHLVLQHGHLWGMRQITIPIKACAGMENDEVKLSLSKDEVGELRPARMHRWQS